MNKQNTINAQNESGHSSEIVKPQGSGSIPAAAAPQAATVAPGGKAMPIFLMLIGVFFFLESLKLQERDASLAGYATMPLLISALIFLLALIDFIQTLKLASANTGGNGWERTVTGLKYLFPSDTVITIALVVVYCAGLELGLGFLISSLIYLFLSMCIFIPRKLIKNLIYSVVCMGAIMLVFKVLFKVFLP